MLEQYHIQGRTGKQCRERYFQTLYENAFLLRLFDRWHNQLDPNIKSDKWTEAEEALLFQYHNTYGNKWAKISQHIPGRYTTTQFNIYLFRTDNSIKNHFYSTLRKALRRVNRYVIDKKVRGDLKEIKPNILSKILMVCEQKFQASRNTDPNSSTPPFEPLNELCYSIKNRLVSYSNDCGQQHNLQSVRTLITDIHNFSRYIRVNKSKKRRSGALGERSDDSEWSANQDSLQGGDDSANPSSSLIKKATSSSSMRSAIKSTNSIKLASSIQCQPIEDEKTKDHEDRPCIQASKQSQNQEPSSQNYVQFQTIPRTSPQIKNAIYKPLFFQVSNLINPSYTQSVVTAETTFTQGMMNNCYRIGGSSYAEGDDLELLSSPLFDEELPQIDLHLFTKETKQCGHPDTLSMFLHENHTYEMSDFNNFLNN